MRRGGNPAPQDRRVSYLEDGQLSDRSVFYWRCTTHVYTHISQRTETKEGNYRFGCQPSVFDERQLPGEFARAAADSERTASLLAKCVRAVCPWLGVSSQWSHNSIRQSTKTSVSQPKWAIVVVASVDPISPSSLMAGCTWSSVTRNATYFPQTRSR